MRFLPHLTAAALAVTATGAHAAVISVNLYRDDGTLGTSDVAGVVADDNWTNLKVTGSASDLVNGDGVATAADITMSESINGNRVSASATLASGADQVMMSSARTNTGSITAEVSEIPYATYDIYAYVISGNSGVHDGTGDASVSDGSTTYVLSTADDDLAYFIANGYVRSTDTNAADGGPLANYVLFEGLTGDFQTITLNYLSGTRTGLAGIQIVEASEIPEPASLALMGLGGLMMLGRSKRATP